MEGVSLLQQTLADLRAEGRHDSQGYFKIDWRHALDKLGASARQYPTRWLYFAAQAAVASGSGRINVSCSRTSISVEFSLPQQYEGLESVDNILNESRPRSPAASFLYSALLWAQAVEPTSAQLLYQDALGGYIYSLDGGQESRSQVTPQDEARVALCCYFKESARLQKWITDIHRNLGIALRYCPALVTLDGRTQESGEPLDSLEGARTVRGFHVYRRLVLCGPGAASSLVAAPPLRWPAARIGVESQSSFACPGGPYVLGELEVVGELSGKPPLIQPAGMVGAQQLELARWNEDGVARQMLLSLDHDPRLCNGIRCRALFYRVRREQGLLHLVHYGLTLEPIPLAELAPHGWGVVIASNTVSTDFHGLKSVENEKVRQLTEWSRAVVAQIYKRQAERQATFSG